MVSLVEVQPEAEPFYNNIPLRFAQPDAVPMKFLQSPLLVVAIVTGSSVLFAQEKKPAGDPDSEGVRFFEAKIRPILADHCYECHGATKQESSLRLDTVAGILAGGDRGQAIAADDPQASLLLVAIGYQDDDLQMPPEEANKLSASQVTDVRRWIEMGAPLPISASTASQTQTAIDFDAARQHWAFQPPQTPTIPDVANADWCQNEIDRFVMAKLEDAGISPAPPADKQTLIRRATFDLIGLPPTPEQIDRFLADESPEAFAHVIDRLLQSPHYGERWGRHWLDVARYADSNGLDENICHGNAWRYRNWVIDAVNRDLPYDQFITAQLAGDLLPPVDDRQTMNARLVATGFLSLGPKVLAEVDKTKMEMDIIDEQIDTIGRSLLGLTIGCARCHDHKFDPITIEDYYGLAGIFKSTKTMESLKTIARWWENPIANHQQQAAQDVYDQQVTEKKSRINTLIKAANEQVKASLAAQKASEGATEDPSESDPAVDRAAMPTENLTAKQLEERYPAKTKAELIRLRDDLAAFEKTAPQIPTAMGVIDADVTDLKVHLRGSHLKQGQLVPRRFPVVMAGTNQPTLNRDQSGRLQLAQWLVRADHPLTSRVMVNRLWRWHFGNGIVATTDNFGHVGSRPANQPLLDYLAVQFRDCGWSIKQMHRKLMLSSTYQTSSRFDAASAQIDPDNQLQWRFNVRRLEAEAIRDAMLAVSGELDPTRGTSSLHVENRAFFFDHTSIDKTSYDERRRSIYLPVVRNHLYEAFQLFDYNDASVSTSDRTTSTVAPQALYMLNSDFVSTMADAMSRRLLLRFSDAERTGQLYRIALGRWPSDGERERAENFLNRSLAMDSPSGARSVREQAWSSLCQVMFASNEFIYVK